MSARNSNRAHLTEATDVRALRDLAEGWREVSRRSRYDRDRELHDDDPGPHMTAIQLEWAAREIESLRAVIERAHDYCARPTGVCLPAPADLAGAPNALFGAGGDR